MNYHFIIGKEYTRRQLRILTGQSPDRRGGDWDTGYAEHKGEFFIFCMIEGAGRTGHNYGNHFVGDDLVWFTKGNKGRDSEQTQRLLSADIIKYLFTRDDDQAPFTYRGTVTTRSIEGDQPVKVTWAISTQGSSEKSDGSPRYFARLCWNSACWVHPTGDAAQSETDTFATENGFGHEEWLFDFSRLIDGYKYGFIQGVSFSFNRITGTAVSVDLFSIAPNGERFMVGRIKSLEVLTQSEAETVKAKFHASGWLNLMSEQVAMVAGKAQMLDVSVAGENMFNVRFRLEEVEIFEPFVPVSEGEQVHRLKRYQMVEQERTDDTDEQNGRPRARKGIKDLKSIAPIVRRPSGLKEFDPVHNRMQNELCHLLRSRFGDSAVLLEENFVDIKISTPSRIVFLEIKTDPTPRKAIRQALGQLMDYAFFIDLDDERPLGLVVVGPGRQSRADEEYLKRLAMEFRIPISYRRFTLGDAAFELQT